ncbi:MAG: NUDIX hydrolase [Chloroflexi bacterium]|nr:NUDIX hydrolase [Chloroflexota bacterium]
MLDRDKYCAGCATPLELKEENGAIRPVCPACGRVVYYDPKVAAVTILARQQKVLLVRRANQPGYGLWSVPGGYVDRGEVVEEAAKREVLEETGLIVDVDGLVGLFSEPGRPVIVAAFNGIERGGQLVSGPETLDVGFFALDSLPPMAFPGDSGILETWAGHHL